MTRRLLVLCPFPEGCAAQQRLKYEQYFDDWRDAGWDITVSNFLDRKAWDQFYEPGHTVTKALGVLKGYLRRLRDLGRVADFDLVYVCMWVTPLGGPLFERMVRSRARSLVYDIEDNIVSASPPQVSTLRRLFSWALDRRPKLRFLIRNADAVIVASPYLVGPYGKIAERGPVRLIPPSLDTDRICPLPALRTEGPVVIGWTGTFSSRIYLDLLTDVFRRLTARVPFRLKVIGNFDYDLPGVDLEVVRWSAAREAADLQALDIGVYPLIDDEWSRGKAGLKIIQYQAAGLPCVASDVPLSREQLRNGETGYLVRSDDEWVDRLEELIRDAGLQQRMGKLGRKDAVAGYSQAVIAIRYREVLESAIR